MHSGSPRPRGTARRVLRTLGVAVTLCAAALASVGTPANAGPRPVFYDPPASFDPSPGAVIRTQAMPVLTFVPGVNGPYPGSARRVMYTTRTESGSATTTTGTYVEATTPWRGRGPRPTVVIAPGTNGQGDQCAPSRTFPTGLTVDAADPVTLGANQEAASAAIWNSRGARVFVVDYIGLGTPGVHTYLNRLDQAHAVLDGARAAVTLGRGGPTTPVALWGYSQGGGATSAAAELQPTYAPDIALKGTWSGGPVTDVPAIMTKFDGNLIGGANAFVVNGLLAAHPELRGAVEKKLTPRGRSLLASASGDCIGDVITQYPFLRTGTLTLDRRPFLDNLRAIPGAAEALSEQRVGNLAPRTPVLITAARNDDTVPYAKARQTATDWCGRGATVTFRTNEIPSIAPGTVLPTHFGPEVIDAGGAVSYLEDRIGGVPVRGCTIR